MSNKAAGWKAAGYTLPTELEIAIEVLNAIEDLGFEQAPAPPSLEGVEPGQVAKLITDHGKALAEFKATQEAGTAVAVLAVKLVSEETRKAVPFILEQMRPGFEDASSRFVEAVKALPVNFTPEMVSGFSRQQFEAYSTVRETAAVIAAADSFVSDNRTGTHFALRVFAPETPAQFDLLVRANSGNQVDTKGIFPPSITQAEREIGYKYLVGARHNVPFQLPADLSEPFQRQQDIEQQRADQAAKEAVKPGSFVKPGAGWK